MSKKKNPYEDLLAPAEETPTAPRGRSRKRTEKATTPKPARPKKVQASVSRKAARELRKQKINDFFDVTLPTDHPVDTDLIDTMTLEDLRVDIDEELDPDELLDRGTPWYKLPADVKEEFMTNVAKIGESMAADQERLNASLRGTNTDIENEMIGTPIFLSTGHIHTDIMIPDDLSDYESMEDLHKQRFKNSRILLTMNEDFHLCQSIKYSTFENYISPLLYKFEEGIVDSVISGTIASIDDTISQKLGTRVDGVERFKIGSGEGSTLFCMSYPAENRGLFWVALVFSLDGPFPSTELKQKRYYGIKRFMGEKNTDRVLALKVRYKGHFYYACPCRRPERKEKPATKKTASNNKKK